MREPELLKIIKAMADRNRLRILQILNEQGELSCTNIGDCFPIGQATVSHHLKILTDCGLVKIRREGQFRFVTLNRDLVSRFRSAFTALLPEDRAAS